MNSLTLKMSRVVVAAIFILGIAAGGVFAAEGKVVRKGAVTGYQAPAQNETNAQVLDFQGAIPMPLPSADHAPIGPLEGEAADQDLGTPGVVPGARGSGSNNLLQAFTLSDAASQALGLDEGIVPQEYGTSAHVFTTSRVDLSGRSESAKYPYRATGKLYFNIGASTYMCSASLIKKGVILTAAHCVANYGQKQFYTNWQYIPALYNGTRPYGTWSTSVAWVMSNYYNGTDSCYQTGVICRNDVAVLRVVPQSGVYPGTYTGWLGYGYNGWGFSGGKAQISQLGYPASHDSGLLMQRTDSQGFVSTMVSNTVWGSRQTGGSSGGPEVLNLGPGAVLSGGISYGTAPNRNIAVGVTSWGYTNQAVKQQGASAFTSSNIVPLVNAACAGSFAGCL